MEGEGDQILLTKYREQRACVASGLHAVIHVHECMNSELKSMPRWPQAHACHVAWVALSAARYTIQYCVLEWAVGTHLTKVYQNPKL
jgi:hypothetical protein